MRPSVRVAATTLAMVLLTGLVALDVPGRPEPAVASPVADNDALYTACGRVFPDPQAYWPSPTNASGESPFAKGNAVCRAQDFIQYREMISGLSYLESLFPDFVRFFELEKDFGADRDCATSDNPLDLCSAGLPQQGAGNTREKSDLYMIRITDERVPNRNKKWFVFPLSIHGIERAGAEAGTRAAEDLATWAWCEARQAGQNVATRPGVAAACGQEDRDPAPGFPIMETQPGDSVTAGEALKRSVIVFVFPNPDGWRRGDNENAIRSYQRYNGNGVDLNRDWPTMGFTFRPYTPWSEPETRSFGKVLKRMRGRWDGGIDLHGQLIDRAFSFTLLGASERNYSKNQRILQTVKGAWRDAEKRLSWSSLIKPNDAPPQCTGGAQPPECDERMYGVQWGTVWDTIDYTVTGGLGDWIDSPLGLNADGIDNEMSLSHLSNCGTGTCYIHEAEQLHVDGNKSLIYAMVNYTLRPEDRRFRAPGRIAYIHNPKVLRHAGRPAGKPVGGKPAQPDETDVILSPANGYSHEFEVKAPSQGFSNGGVTGTVTPLNAAGISGSSAVSSVVIERFRPPEENPEDFEDEGCGVAGDDWEEVNRYYNQGSAYAQAGQAVHANAPRPGRWRICVTGEPQLGGTWDLDIDFTGQKAWEDPGQLPYEVTNMRFFRSLARHMPPGQLVAVPVGKVLRGEVDLRRFTSVVVADDPFPGFVEPLPRGPAQADQPEFDTSPGQGTAPCGYSSGTSPGRPSDPQYSGCHEMKEFEISPAFNNQRLTIRLRTADPASDWDLYLERKSRITDEWFPVASSTTPTGNETITLLTPPVGQYRTVVINWSANSAGADSLSLAFSNRYGGPRRGRSTRSQQELDRWASAFRSFVHGGGNLVLTDAALKMLAYMGVAPRTVINNFSAYAGFIGFTRDGNDSTYDDPLARNVNQPGAAEGPQHRHQTVEPVPIGYAIQDEDGADFNATPVWAVDQIEWEKRGGRTVGITTPDQVTLGEKRFGHGRIRIIGSVLPFPTDQYDHPFGLANYAVTYTGYQVLNNALRWTRCPGHEHLGGRHVVGTRGDDVIRGTSGREVICGLGGNDRLYGRDGNDVLIGGPGRDLLRGGKGVDLLLGLSGRDEVLGGRDPDIARGGGGRDLIRGSRGRDRLVGDGGRDIVRGGRGSDAVLGGGGNDRVYGATGNDLVDGGDGRDTCNGGPGRNTFVRCEVRRD